MEKPLAERHNSTSTDKLCLFLLAISQLLFKSKMIHCLGQCSSIMVLGPLPRMF